MFRKKRKDPFKEIQSCLQKRDYKGALDWFNTLLQKDSKNTQIRLRFADTLVLAGSKKEAVKQLRIVADELADKGFMIRAIAINKKILQIDPRQTDVHEKLAEMKEERSTTTKVRPRLADALTRPDEPLRRADEPAASVAAPPQPEPPPQTLPELSLEESMAMEFGDTTTAAEPEPPAAPVKSEPPAAPVESEPPAAPVESDPAPVVEAPAAASGGFEALDHESPADDDDASLPDEPSFAEDPIELGAGSQPDEEVVELSFDGVEAPPQGSPEIVLEMEAAPEPELQVLEASDVQPPVDDPDPAPADEEEEAVEVIVAGEEMEVVEFQMEGEPEMAEEGIGEALVGALGEDIDSLIDSIIDDVGTSAQGGQPEQDEPPTHIPLFSDLTTPEFIDVAILLVRRVLKTGETAVTEGDPGDSMFIISTGEVRATVEKDGQQLAVATLRDGDFFGEMAVLSGEPRTATVTAVKNTEVLELSRENLREICSRHPHVEAKIRLAYDERVASDRSR